MSLRSTGTLRTAESLLTIGPSKATDVEITTALAYVHAGLDFIEPSEKELGGRGHEAAQVFSMAPTDKGSIVLSVDFLTGHTTLRSGQCLHIRPVRPHQVAYIGSQPFSFTPLFDAREANYIPSGAI